MNDIGKTDIFWMGKALEGARRAMKKGEFPVGCILVCQDRIVGTGDRINTGKDEENELDHAEIRALKDWIDRGRPGGTFTAYTTLEPCLMCLGALIINGAHRIVFAYEDIMGGATGIDFTKPFSHGAHFHREGEPAHLYQDFATRIKGNVLRAESLELFKEFFSRPDNTYLKGTLLESYTLSQK